MAENSKIQWTHHTFNPWRGCARVSPGCIHCYAETLSKRNPKTLGTWGVDGTRVVASEDMWRQPLKWDKAARNAGERHRVFCASLADVGEDRINLIAPRERLCGTINQTPYLDWLLLTKRPENMVRFFPLNVLADSWVGTTVEDKPRKERIDILRDVPAKFRFLSIEPLIENIGALDLRGIDWVIVGGESGPGARPCFAEWMRDIVKQCREQNVAPFVKQWGSKPMHMAVCSFDPMGPEPAQRLLKDKKGGDITEWPYDDMRVREFPKAS